MKSIVFLVSVLLILKSDIASAQFWPKTDNLYFRKSGMAFTDSITPHNNRIKFNGIYKLKVDKKYSILIVFFPNGLMYAMSEDEFRVSKKDKHGWFLYRLIGDTIFCLTRDYHNTMGGKYFHAYCYKIWNSSEIQAIGNGRIDRSLNVDENLIAIFTKNYYGNDNNHKYLFMETAAIPSYKKCPWLKRKYFWASDSLYSNFFLKH